MAEKTTNTEYEYITDLIERNEVQYNDPVPAYFRREGDTSDDHELQLAGNNFIARHTSPNPAAGSSAIKTGIILRINRDGIIRDDKLTLITIDFSNSAFLSEFIPDFQKTYLSDEGIRDEITKSLPQSTDNRLYIYFCVKPHSGEFKTGLKPEELVRVTNTVKTESSIVLKAIFTRELAAARLSMPKDDKKKENSMFLHVILVFKKNTDTNYTYLVAIDSFRFLSHDNNNKPYTKKRKLDNIERTEQEKTSFHSAPSVIIPVPTASDLVSMNQSAPATPTDPITPITISGQEIPHMNCHSTTIPQPTVQEHQLSVQPIDESVVLKPSQEPIIYRIHPNQCFLFHNWEIDNPDITFLLVGDNLNLLPDIKVFFVYNGHFCEAKEKKTQYNEKEYFVPCIKRIFPKNDDDSPNIPDDGLVVDVIFRGSNGENIQKIQKYTYMPLHQAAQTSFFGTSSVQNSQPPQSRGLSIFNFPERCDEAEVISYYESNNLSVELRDQYQRTILHYAIQLEFKDLLIYALNYGANINDPDMFGFTPLHLAVYLGNLDFVKILRKFGASFNIEDTNGNNPFRLAVECKQYVILNYLLKKGFSKFKVIKDRIPALHLSQVSRWLKSMDGKCTIYWRLHAIPYLPPITRLICSAAVIERPKFVHFNDKTGMYSIKIRHAAIIEKKLFPDAKKSTLNKYNRDLRAGTESNEEFMEQSYDANGSDSSDEEVTDRGKIKLSSSDPNPNYYCSKLGKSAFRKDLEVVQDKMDKVAFLGEIRPKDRSKSASKYVFQKPV